MLKDMSLRRWIWRSYWRSAIVPLFVIEVVFIAVYFVSVTWFTQNSIDMSRKTATNQLSHMSLQQAETIDAELNSVGYFAKLYQEQAKAVLQQPQVLAPEDRSRLAYSVEGKVYHSTSDNSKGGAAVFYSGIQPVGERERDKVRRLLSLQYLMKDIAQAQPLIASIYINTFDSLNVIYPYFNVMEQYAPFMDIPSFNFYYEADKVHNPERKIRWTDAYLDPAGHGWMMSALAPVYNEDFLEGVVGIDVTIDNMLKRINTLQIPWGGYAMLVNKEGLILTIPQQGEADFDIKELTDHAYTSAIMEQQLKPDQFNLYKKEDLRDLVNDIVNEQTGIKVVKVKGSDRLISWSTIQATGWKMVFLVPTAAIYAEINATASHLKQVGNYMIAGLLVFYSLFFAFLYRRSQHMATRVAQPLVSINRMAALIGQGVYQQDIPNSSITELQNTAGILQRLGEQLGEMVQRLQEKSEEAEKASQAKSEFLSAMSHELRTPLNAIMGFTKILEMDGLAYLPPNQQEYVKEVQTAAKYLLELINQVLDLTKIESGTTQACLERISMDKVLEQCIPMVTGLAEKYQVSIHNHCEQCRERVIADGTYLRQIVINLLSNGIKYNKRQGRVSISCEKRGNCLRVIIEDTGIGIEQDQLPYIFEPFYRIKNKWVVVDGSGVGLAVTRKLLGLMGGQIGVNSKPEEGSQFWFELPLAPQEDDRAQAQEENTKKKNPLVQDWSGKRVLLVEDNETNQKVAKLMLKRCGILAEVAENGQEAVEKIAKVDYDLILMDCQMPVMDGFEAAKQIREMEKTVQGRALVIVAMTANAMLGDKEKCAAAGMDDYLPKPVEFDSLLDCLRRWFQ